MEYKRLPEKRPYVYEIKNKYYCIGLSIFRECTYEEIVLYKKINTDTATLKEIHKENYGKYWKNSVCDDFAKLLDLCNVKCSDSEIKRCKCEYEKLLSVCLPEEREKINSQIEIFVKFLDLKWEAEADNLAKKG